MEHQKTGIGVMGCASIADRLMLPAILQQSDKFELIAIASRTADKARQFAEKFNTAGITGYENLLSNESIQLIYMPLPTGLHEEWIIRCLEAGKHVLVEKSLAMDYPSAQRIATKAKEKNLLIMEDFMYRYHRQHQYVFSLLKDKAVGDLRLFRSAFGFPPLAENNFRYDAGLGGGALLDAGAYTAHVAQWFLGKDLSVSGSILYMDKNRKTDIYGHATLISKEGVAAQLSFGFDNFYQCNYEIWGSKGHILAQKAFTPKPNENPTIVYSNSQETLRHNSEADNHFYNILSEAHRCIGSGDIAEHRENILAQARILQEIRDKATLIYI